MSPFKRTPWQTNSPLSQHAFAKVYLAAEPPYRKVKRHKKINLKEISSLVTDTSRNFTAINNDEKGTNFPRMKKIMELADQRFSFVKFWVQKN